MTWADGEAIAMDLYYDPVANEHLASPMGLLAPIWYLAPQRRNFAESAWINLVSTSGLLDDGGPVGLDDPRFSVMLAWHTGEFADGEVRSRLWDHLESSFEPSWDREAGEFSFRFGLDEPHPRGQLNARTMAGWVCTPGAWSRIFNEPNLKKFSQPTVRGLDFPRVAMSEARWDGTALYLAADPQNASVAGTRSSVRVDGLPPDTRWTLIRPDGSTSEMEMEPGATATQIELVVDRGSYQLRKLDHHA